MRIGCVGTADRIEDIAKIGFDFVELSLKALLGDEDKIQQMEALLKKTGLKAETFNCFFPKEVQLVGAGVDKALIRKTTEDNIRLIQRFGGDLVVIGSGGARKIPEGYTKKDALESFGEALNNCCELCGKEGITVTVEPLRRSETNFINTIRDAMEMVDYLKNPYLSYMVDFFHFAVNGEDLADLDPLKGKLKHAHLARPNEDRQPPVKEDEKTVRLWAEKLKELDYHDRLVFECRYQPDFMTAMKDAIPMIPFLREV